MAWGSPQQPSSKQQDGGDRADKTRFAVPPACPRCELTKAQMNRTIQNYQKAYRKKVEGLKQELTTVRADNQALRGQVRRLRRKRWLQPPSLVLGAGLGALLARAAQHLWQRRQQQQQQQPGQAEGGDKQHQAAAAADSNGLAAAS